MCSQCREDDGHDGLLLAGWNEGAGAQIPPPGNIASLYSIYVQCHEDYEGPLMGLIMGGLPECHLWQLSKDDEEVVGVFIMIVEKLSLWCEVN